jgi:hypothetical protein
MGVPVLEFLLNSSFGNLNVNQEVASIEFFDSTHSSIFYSGSYITLDVTMCDFPTQFVISSSPRVVCAAISQCKKTEFESSKPTPTSDRVCLNRSDFTVFINSSTGICFCGAVSTILGKNFIIVDCFPLACS